MSDNLESILTEQRIFEPSAATARRARIQADDLSALHRQAEADHEGFWADLARRELDWQTPFEHVLDDSEPPFYKWFTDGELNVCYNCIDRHLAHRGDHPAIIFEGEAGDIARYTFRDVHREVCLVANALRAHGVEHGDRVIIYMPMVPQAVFAMLACARIGAIHSVVFGGFSADALRGRNRGHHVVPGDGLPAGLVHEIRPVQLFDCVHVWRDRSCGIRKVPVPRLGRICRRPPRVWVTR